MLAAAPNDTLGGLSASLSSVVQTYSAYAPLAIPNTSSPGRNLVTAAPTASTIPETSPPNDFSRGSRHPAIRRMKTLGMVNGRHSMAFTEDECTLSSTWFGAGTGFSLSCNSSTAGGPHRV